MREGQLLAEDSPTNIMSKLQVNSVEDAFLKLCMRSSFNKKSIEFPEYCDNSIINGNDDDTLYHESLHNNIINQNKQNSDNQKVTLKLHRKMKALLIKNLISISRRPM